MQWVGNIYDQLAEELPPGFNSPNEVASVLADEPSSAKSARFAEAAPAAASTGSDTITFQATGSSGGKSTDVATQMASAQFDGQIEQVKMSIKRVRQAIKVSEAACRRKTEQKAELRNLLDQKTHLEKEKDKKILEHKLTKQMKDLSEISRMSRALRLKFSELKRTQMLIRTKMKGTKSALGQIDREGGTLLMCSSGTNG